MNLGLYIAKLKEDLALAQADNQRLRELVARYRNETPPGNQPHMICTDADKALSTPLDTSALEAIVQKAGEVMRERCAKESDPFDEIRSSIATSIENAIHALPGVTLEDLK